MSQNLEDQAIKAAINQNWGKAVEINKKIVKENKNNITALNRLAHAYCQTGETKKASETYKQVLEIDAFNPIASKNLKRVNKAKKFKPNNAKATNNFYNSGNMFLEEPGKTKLVSLVRLAQPSILAQINPAQPVLLDPKKRTVSIIAEDKTYLGTIPEDLSLRLIKFIKGGNQYQAFIKNVDHQKLEIFIKEVARGKKFINNPSFFQGKFSNRQ